MCARTAIASSCTGHCAATRASGGASACSMSGAAARPEVRLQIFFRKKRRPVDTLHRLVARIALPVRVRRVQHFERFQFAGRRNVRAEHLPLVGLRDDRLGALLDRAGARARRAGERGDREHGDAGRAGAERATPEQREKMLEIAHGMNQAAKTNDDISFMRLDRELNQLMVEAAHNDYAARSMKLLQGLSRRFWYMHYREAADLPLCARLHADQARAIANGDRTAAARASDKLMDYVESFTRATVSV